MEDNIYDGFLIAKSNALQGVQPAITIVPGLAIPESASPAISLLATGTETAVRDLQTVLQSVGLTIPTEEITSKLHSLNKTISFYEEILAKAAKDPVTSLTVIGILSSPAMGATWQSRFNMVLHYLTLGLNESGLDSNSIIHSEPVVRGRKLKTTTFGQLQFTQATFNASLITGKEIINDSLLFKYAFNWMLSNYLTSIAKREQVLANIGQMYTVARQVFKQWTWKAPDGWVPVNSNVLLLRNFNNQFRANLAQMNLGRQAIITLYHTNGLYIATTSSTKVPNPKRIIKDILTYHSLASSQNIPLQIKDMIKSFSPSLSSTSLLGDIVDPLVDPSSVTSRIDPYIQSAIQKEAVTPENQQKMIAALNKKILTSKKKIMQYCL